MKAGMGGHGRLLGVWAQQMVQEAVGARAGERISGRLGVLAWRTARLFFGRAWQSGPAPQVGHFQLPLDVLEGAIFGASWGQALVTRILACSKGGFKL